MRLVPLALASACAVAAVPWPGRAGDLVGPESCRTCHAEAYRVWASSAHARAQRALSGEQRKNQLCLYCHSRDEARSGAVQAEGVSCETCHGGGRFYQSPIVMRDRELARLFGLADLSGATAAASCNSCHGGESPSLRPFEVKEALARIDHWTADRAARKLREGKLGSRAAPRDLLATWLGGSGAPSPGAP